MIQSVTKVMGNTGAAGESGAAPKTAPGCFSALVRAAAEKKPGNGRQDLGGIFDRAAALYGVPVNLLKAVAKAESGFQTDAVSCCGAQGIMQLMPSTAAALGVRNPFDAEQNIMGGAKYLSGLMSTFGGDAKLAVAAYNAGSGSVKEYGGVPPYAETQNYVKKVLGYAGGDISVRNWPSAAAGGVAGNFGGDSSAGQSPGGADLDGLTFSETDYSRFARIFVQKLEQDAMDKGVASAGEYDDGSGQY